MAHTAAPAQHLALGCHRAPLASHSSQIWAGQSPEQEWRVESQHGCFSQALHSPGLASMQPTASWEGAHGKPTQSLPSWSQLQIIQHAPWSWQGSVGGANMDTSLRVKKRPGSGSTQPRAGRGSTGEDNIEPSLRISATRSLELAGGSQHGCFSPSQWPGPGAWQLQGARMTLCWLLGQGARRCHTIL